MDTPITKKKVIELAEKYRRPDGNPDVKRIAREFVRCPEKRHYQRVVRLIPTSMIGIWYVIDDVD